MTENYTVRYSSLTMIAFFLNGALGSGKYDGITIVEVKQQIRQGNIFKYLEDTLGDDIDLSLLKVPDKQELTSEWEDMVESINESSKLCVDRNGLALLVAYLLEGIQRRVRE